MAGERKGPQIEYYPPSHEILTHFAQDVGNELGGAYAEPEIVQGLADFMTVVATLLARDLNRKGQTAFDNRIE